MTTATTGDTDAEQPAFIPVLSQADFDRRLAGRLDRERTKHEAKLAEIEQSHQAELQRRDTALQSMRADLVRSRVAMRYGLSEDDAATLLTGSDEATLTAQAVRLMEMGDNRRPAGNVVSREGSNPASSGRGELSEFIHELFSSPDSMS